MAATKPLALPPTNDDAADGAWVFRPTEVMTIGPAGRRMQVVRGALLVGRAGGHHGGRATFYPAGGVPGRVVTIYGPSTAAAGEPDGVYNYRCDGPAIGPDDLSPDALMANVPLADARRLVADAAEGHDGPVPELERGVAYSFGSVNGRSRKTRSRPSTSGFHSPLARRTRVHVPRVACGCAACRVSASRYWVEPS